MRRDRVLRCSHLHPSQPSLLFASYVVFLKVISLVKQISLGERGEGFVRVEFATLPSGVVPTSLSGERSVSFFALFS